MLRVCLAAAALAAAAVPAAATTVTSNTIDSICDVRIVIYGSPAVGGQVTLYQGALQRGGLTLMLIPSQGNRVCYTRNVEPQNCASPRTADVCAPVTASPADVFDVR